MFQEFKKFITRGNVMDLAVGVVIGSAFQSIITSLVEDIIMPVVSAITGNVDFSELSLTIGKATLNYGKFITAIIDFLLIAFVIFLAVKYVNRLNEKLDAINQKVSKDFEKQKEKITKKQEEFNQKHGLKLNLNNNNHKETNVEPAEPETKFCPYCLSEIPYKAIKCAHCGSDMPTENK